MSPLLSLKRVGGLSRDGEAALGVVSSGLAGVQMDAEQDVAASRMAAAQKGKKARAEVEEQKRSASKVAAAQKGKTARREKEAQKKSATSMQARHRGNLERKKADTSGQRYYTPAEVTAHNRADDLWVTMFQKVVDLTDLVASNPGHLVEPMIEAAGTDISHWFDSVTKDVRTYIDPETELEVPFCPMGAFLHCPPPMPTADWSSNIGKPWWKDPKLRIGMLTAKTRKINLFNMLTKQSTILEVCSEETLEEIQRRYLAFNKHSGSYTWKRTDEDKVARLLDMRQTLAANGIPDEDNQFELLNLDPMEWVPIIHLYFSDDLTVA